MRLKSLRVQHFGHFVDAPLELDGDARFVVIYGPNGAGKTTLLNAFRNALFGFPRPSAKQNSYIPDEANAPMSAISAKFVDIAGDQFDIVRHRGNHPLTGTKTSATGGRLADLNDDSFASSLGVRDRDLYESVFGFTLSDLEQGREILTKATFSQLLAGGSLGRDGARRVSDLTSYLSRAVEDSWKPVGRSDAIHKRVSTLDDRSKRLKDGLASEPRYTKQRSEQQKSKEKVTSLADQMAVLRKRERDLTQLLMAWPHQEARATALTLLAAHATITGIESSDDVQRVQKLLQRVEVARVKQEACQTEVDSLTERVEAHTPEFALLACDRQVRTLAANAQEINRLRVELPRNRERIESRLREARCELEKLAVCFDAIGIVSDVTGESDPVLDRESFFNEAEVRVSGFLSQASKAEINKIHDAWRELSADCANQERELERARTNLSEGFVGFKPEGEGADAARLMDLARPFLPGLEGYKNDLREHERLQREESEKQIVLDALALSLDPILPTSTQVLASLRLPDRTTVQSFNDRWAVLILAVDAARTDCDTKADQVIAEGSRLEAFFEDSVVVTEAIVAETRLRRDQLLAAWEVSLIECGEDPVLRERPLGAAANFKAALLVADEKADVLARCYAAVNELRHLRSSCSAAKARSDEAMKSLSSCQSDLEEWFDTWRKYWAGFGMPLTDPPGTPPSGMVQWLGNAERVRVLAAELVQIRTARLNCAERVDPLDRVLRAVLPEAAKVSFEARIALLEERRRSEVDNRVRLEETEKHLIKRREDINSRIDEITALRETIRVFDMKCQSLLLHHGLRTELSVSEAHEVISLLSLLSETLFSCERDSSELEGPSERVKDYDADVARVVALLQPDDEGLPPLDAKQIEGCVEDWYTRLTEAERCRAARGEAEKGLLKKREELSRLTDECLSGSTEIEAWLVRTGCGSDTSLYILAKQCAEHFEQSKAVDSSDRSIKYILNSEVELISELEATLTPEGWISEKESLSLQIGEVDSKYASAQRAQWEGEELIKEMGTDAAIVLRSQIEEDRSALGEEVNQHIVCSIALQVLKEVTARYIRENQPELLRDASAMLSGITAGAFTDVMRSADEKDLAVMQRGVPAQRLAAKLSTGEREQLFLALRLCYVSQQCRIAEPMPIALDDVLVNFDEERAASTLVTLSEVSKQTQVLFFTCHKSLRDLARRVVPGAFFYDVPTSVRPKL